MTKKVLVVDGRADWYVEQLRDAFPELALAGAPTFAVATDHFGATEILITIGGAADGVPLTREIVAQMPKLEWVQCLISGTEHIVQALETRSDVLVTSAKGIHGRQMSEMAVMHMLMLSRSARAILRNQDARVWERPPQNVLDGKIVGIVGLGAIGGHLARLCRAFGMTVYGLSRSGRPVEGVDRVFQRTELERLAAEVDFLVLVVPATADTAKLVDATVLSAMKPTAYLVNLARGAVVDEETLVSALRDGRIAGAGLDVFAVEPLSPESPLWAMENVVITPHVGGFSDRYAERAIAVVEPNLRNYLAGRQDELLNVVHRP